jgi:hypothetical protein
MEMTVSKDRIGPNFFILALLCSGTLVQYRVCITSIVITVNNYRGYTVTLIEF